MPSDPLANPPGLRELRRRIGTFASFRRAMLEDTTRQDLLRALSPDPRHPLDNPLVRQLAPTPDSAPAGVADWHPAGAGDYEVMLIELWAYVADVLAFYQERIANEAYLPTATQRASVAALAYLNSFQPSPGVGASSILAFFLDQDKKLNVPGGFRVGGAPPPGAPPPPPVFETSMPLNASDKLNRIPIPDHYIANQFTALDTYATVQGQTPASSPRAPAARRNRRVAAAQGVFGAAGGALALTFAELPPLAAASPLNLVVQPTQTRSIVLEGTKTKLAPNDLVLVEDASHQPTVHKLLTVVPDDTSKTTTITWSEADDSVHASSGYAVPVTLYAFRVKAAPFGSAAPPWLSLQLRPPATAANPDPANQLNWDNPVNAWYHLPPPDDSATEPRNVPPSNPETVLWLDRLYDAIKASNPQLSSWAVLVDAERPTPGPPVKQAAFLVEQADAGSRAAYGMSGRVTRLVLDKSYKDVQISDRFRLRTTVVLAGSEPLAVAPSLPLPAAMTGNHLVLQGDYSTLTPGRPLVVRGKPFPPDPAAPPNQTVAEVVTIDSVGVAEADGAVLTTVTLRGGLQHTYMRAGAEVLANVVTADQGQSVVNEIIGSGNAAPNQVFMLKRKPLIYLPAVTPEGQAVIRSTLEVTVNGEVWNETETLAGTQPDDRVYKASQDDAEQTLVTFGDGVHGNRPPTGVDNIRASYRFGAGGGGNVPADGLAQLLDSLPGLQKVTNPLAATGGVGRDSAEAIRAKAVASKGTFGRAVVPADYAALALSFGNIAKAAAFWNTSDSARGPHVQLVAALSDSTPLAEHSGLARQLRSYLGARSPINVPLRIGGYSPVPLQVEVNLDLDDRAPRQATVALAQAALGTGRTDDGSPGFFAFERLALGQTIYLSAVYQVAQAVPGVRSVTVTVLRRVGASDATPIADDVVLGPTELIVIANDVTHPELGTLLVKLGAGGFQEA